MPPKDVAKEISFEGEIVSVNLALGDTRQSSHSDTRTSLTAREFKGASK